ncbi:hypothetical protein JTE90_020094 [Oedothorax gibbosus]|uniref:Sm domain-containing protein n=1 Tax=Oedothorax gibbosus TaxID=931172 RepID=A0AAV6VQP4_9ARAC|nr:hypothetical protein JTE90_020094 [Oedothorax gibbosus]
MFSQKPKEVGVPEKLLKEFVSKKVTVDTSTGEVFAGTLVDIEENMNMSLSEVKATFPSGHTVHMTCVFIKGTKIRCISLPRDARDIVRHLARKQLSSQRGGRGRGGYRGRGGRGGGGGRGFDRQLSAHSYNIYGRFVTF